jgi:hypothetical protein
MGTNISDDHTATMRVYTLKMQTVISSEMLLPICQTVLQYNGTFRHWNFKISHLINVFCDPYILHIVMCISDYRRGLDLLIGLLFAYRS